MSLNGRQIKTASGLHAGVKGRDAEWHFAEHWVSKKRVVCRAETMLAKRCMRLGFTGYLAKTHPNHDASRNHCLTAELPG